MLLSWFCPDYFWDSISTFWEEKVKEYGPLLSGALFGFGWWFWIDAVVVNTVHQAPQFIPGFLATFAFIIMTIVQREEMGDYDPFDDFAERRTRLWLLISYLLSFGAVLGSVIILISDYALKDINIWPGVACVLQVAFVLASGLVFYLSKLSSDSYLPAL